MNSPRWYAAAIATVRILISRRHLRWARHVALVAMILAAPIARAGVFDVGTMRADRAEIIVDPGAAEEVPDSTMLQRIAGIRAILSPRELSQLRAGVIQGPRVPIPPSARRIAIVRLGAASKSARVEIFQAQSGELFARELDPPTSSPEASPPDLAATLRRDAWDKVARTLDPFCGGFNDQTLASRPLDAIETGSVWPAPWIIDGDEIDRRFTGRQEDRAPPARDLSMERFAIHVGPGLTAHRPAALLVWLSPMANATIPPALADAATKQGFIVIAPTDAGSTRELTNRIQIALDAAYAAMARWHIDPQRVYVGGFSSGAGLANLVLMAFPDVFQGSLLANGASFYQEIQSGPGSLWPRQFNEPAPGNMKLLAARRSAAIVGELDPARAHVVAVAKRMSLESIRAEVFIVPEIAHEIPGEAYFTRALQWLDADAAAEWDARCERGARLLEAAHAARDAAARRRALTAVTREAPWTPAAWQAVEMLNARAGNE